MGKDNITKYDILSVCIAQRSLQFVLSRKIQAELQEKDVPLLVFRKKQSTQTILS